ncbi:MAG: hypothetical protein K6A92_05500 [Lachnospiraceae bacterium]|nr:hypothetical protein [Lachnospiraceae bacterium]
MFQISELHRATLIMDMAAVFILSGLLIHTAVYRKRGRTDDKLFFAMSIITCISAVADAVTYILDGGTFPHAAMISLICNNIFFLTFQLFAVLVVLYLLVRYQKGKGISRKMVMILGLPALIMMILILVNNGTYFLYHVDPSVNEFVMGPWYNLIFVGPAIYGVVALVLILKIDARVTWLYILLLAMRLFLGSLLRGVSSTPLIFAMGLAFIHIHVMGTPFYEEVSE